MKHIVDFELDGKTVSLETGRLAKQAGGAVVVRSGDTQVLVTATAASSPREGIDFFPLTVDYREYTYSAGRFPGGYIKREGRPTEKETVTCRMIDRPLRPLFPAGFRNETQIIAFVLSADPDHDPSVYAMVGASAAVAISDIPVVHTTGSVRVARIGEDEWVLNPSYEQVTASNVHITVAAAKDGIVMVEADANEADERAMLEAIRRGHEGCKEIVKAIGELVEKAGKPKRDFAAPVVDQSVRDEIEAKWGERAEEALDTSVHPKLESYALFRAIKKEIKEAYAGDADKLAQASAFFDPWQEKMFRKQVFDLKRRPDHRPPDAIRTITCEVSELARAHGSAVFTRGETQALVTTTLGTKTDGQRQERIEDPAFEKRFMVHYNFPPFSVGETGFMRGAGRREIGHGLLGERALTPVIPEHEEFPYTIRIVSDILESNGSSSMATVCGGTLSMMDAGVPIKAPVAGIAMGLVTQDDDFVVLTDIAGAEDHYGDMDFKVAGTEDGITALQMDIKQPKVSLEVLETALEQARKARLEILDKMLDTLGAPRKELAEHAPQITQIQIPESKIRDVIGPGGKIIKGLQEETGAKIDVDDSGMVSVASSDRAKGKLAIERIKALTASPEVGKEYLGTVTKIANFGAFVEIFPGTEGLLHISEISEQRVREVSDELKEGDQVLVKCLALDGNRIKLSRRAILQERRGSFGGSERSSGRDRRGGDRPPRERSERGGGDRPSRERSGRGRRYGRSPRPPSDDGSDAKPPSIDPAD